MDPVGKLEVAVGDDSDGLGPSDAKGRIIPPDPTRCASYERRIYHVKHLGCVFQNLKSMREARRDVDRVPILRGKLNRKCL